MEGKYCHETGLGISIDWHEKIIQQYHLKNILYKKRIESNLSQK